MTTASYSIEVRLSLDAFIDTGRSAVGIPAAMEKHLLANGIPANPYDPSIVVKDDLSNLSEAMPTVSSGTLRWVYYNRRAVVEFTWTA